MHRLIVWVVVLFGFAGAFATSRADLITFDDIPAGFIGTHYLSRGVMFYVGNGEYGTSTGLLMQGGQPVTATVGDYGTSISQPNVMNSGGNGAHGNADILVQFFAPSTGLPTFATSVGISNDTDGNPAILYIEGFNASGVALGRTEIAGASQSGVFSAPDIAYADIYSAPNQFGIIGVDNFTYTLASVPEPTSMLLLGSGLLGLIGYARYRRRRYPSK